MISVYLEMSLVVNCGVFFSAQLFVFLEVINCLLFSFAQLSMY